MLICLYQPSIDDYFLDKPMVEIQTRILSLIRIQTRILSLIRIQTRTLSLIRIQTRILSLMRIRQKHSEPVNNPNTCYRYSYSVYILYSGLIIHVTDTPILYTV